MKNLFTKTFILGVSAAVLTLASCKKEDVVINNTKTDDPAIKIAYEQLPQVAAQTNATVNRALGLFITKNGHLAAPVSGTFSKPKSGRSSGFSCAVFTVDTVSPTKTVLVDFGSGCSDGNGNTVSGSMEFSGPELDLNTAGADVTITFTNFALNSDTISGTWHAVNNGPNVNGNTEYTLQTNITSDRVVNNMHYNGTQSYNMELFIVDPNDANANYSLITGGGNGTINGVAFTQTITQTITQNEGDDSSICGGIPVSGKVLFSKSGYPDEETDYGNGTCDKQAVVTTAGHPRTIDLY